jgi:hypothetical protein
MVMAASVATVLSTGCMVEEEESISSAEQGIYRGWRRLDQNGVGTNWGGGPGEGDIESTTGLDLSLTVDYETYGEPYGYASGWAWNYGDRPVWVDTVVITICTDGQVLWFPRSQVLFPVVPWQSPSDSGSVMAVQGKCPAGTGISAASFFVQADN